MNCQFCGTAIPEGDQFCGQCGARAPVAAPPVAGDAAERGGQPTPATPPAVSPPAPYGEAARARQEALGGAPDLPPASATAPVQWSSGGDLAGLAAPVHAYGGFWIRFGAYLLDSLFAAVVAIIPGAILAGLFFVLVQAGQEDALTSFEQDEQDDELVLAAFIGFFLGYFPAYLGYQVISTALGGGWGKRICGLRIIKKDGGARPGYGTGSLRVLVAIGFGFVQIIPLIGWAVWLLDYLWAVWDPEKQTLHDKAVGTVVVRV